METFKLIGMTDFVFETKNWIKENNKVEKDQNFTISIALDKISNYAHFLKRPLKLSMFVPCNEDGIPLPVYDTEPNKEDYWDRDNEVFNAELYKFHLEVFRNYKRAKEKVLFEEWVLITEWYGSHLIAKNSYGRDQIYLKDYISIENLLLDKDLDLTESAIKEIGL